MSFRPLNRTDLTILVAAILVLLFVINVGAGGDIADLKVRVSILEATCGEGRP